MLLSYLVVPTIFITNISDSNYQNKNTRQANISFLEQNNSEVTTHKYYIHRDHIHWHFMSL